MQTAEFAECISQTDFIQKMNYRRSSSFIYLYKIRQKHNSIKNIYHFNHCIYLRKFLLKGQLFGREILKYFKLMIKYTNMQEKEITNLSMNNF